MSGWTRLSRLVTSTLVDGTPGGTGRSSSSTGSTMHMSVLNTSTSSPGALMPTRPSVEPKVSTTGAPKASVMAALTSGRSVSLVEVTACGAMCRRPDRCSAPRRSSTEAYPNSAGGWKALSRATISASGSVAGMARNQNGIPPPAHTAGATPVACTADGAAERLEAAHQRPGQRGEEAHQRRPVEDEHTALARAAARRHGQIAVEDRHGLGSGRRQCPFDEAAVEPAVGEDVVERRHHVRLGHDRQGGEVGRLDGRHVDARQTTTVER